MKTCKKCGLVKPLSEFHPHKQMKDGHRNDCRSCHAQASREWTQANRERHNARNLAWKAKNLEHARLKATEAARIRRAKDPERHNTYSKKWKVENRHRTRAAYVARTYGITQEEFLRMLTECEGKCAICGDETPLHVDHDHATGRVRGLLCRPCNYLLGWARDDEARLRLAISYLNRHDSQA